MDVLLLVDVPVDDVLVDVVFFYDEYVLVLVDVLVDDVFYLDIVLQCQDALADDVLLDPFYGVDVLYVLVDVLVDDVFYLDIVLQCLYVLLDAALLDLYALLDDELPDLACLHGLVWLHVHGVLSDAALLRARSREDTSKHQAQTLH